MDSLLNWALQGTIVAAAAAAGLRVIASSRAAARDILLWAACIAVLALPAVPSIAAAIIPPAAAPTGSAAPGPLVSMPDSWWSSPALAAGFWLLWSLTSAVRLGADALAVRAARRACWPCPAELEARLPNWSRVRATGRPTRVMLSTRVRSAAVLGCGPPVIAIAPALIDRLGDADLDRVVIHEWAHVQRRDDFAHAVQLLIQVVAGWHPAVWWLGRRLELERESGCDLIAVRETGSAKRYASCLARLAAWPGEAGGLRALAAASPSGLRRRVVRILAAPRPAAADAGWPVTASAGVLLLGVALVVGHVNIVEVLDAATSPPPRAPIVAPRGIGRVPGMLSFESGSQPTVGRRQRPPKADVPGDRPVSDPPAAAAAPIAVAASAPDPVPRLRRQEPESLNLPTVAELPALPEVERVPAARPSMPGLPADTGRAPWIVAADAGVAIGRGSQTAGVATAGFFTRLGKKIGGAF